MFKPEGYCPKCRTPSFCMVYGRDCDRRALHDWSPESHLGALPDRPAPTSGKIIPGKSRRIPRK